MKDKKLNILAFAAHPDDIELGCGGTIIRLAELGHQIDLVCITSGEAGSNKLKPSELKKTREQEAREGAKVLGAKSLQFLELEDIHGERKRDNFLKFVSLIKTHRPQVVFTHSLRDQSGDHQFYSKMVIDAVFTSSGPWLQEIGLEPHKVDLVYGYEVWSALEAPQLLVGIDQQMEKKKEAISKHKSQMGDFSYLEGIVGLNTYRGAISAKFQFAEAFEVIKDCPELCLF